MTSIFTGALWPVIGMGAALELGKLSAVAWLGHRHGSASLALKTSLTILVLVLMGLNAVGTFGYLSRAHIASALAGDLAVAGRGADTEARLSIIQAGVVADLDRRIAQIDKAVDTATNKGRTGSAMALVDQQRKTRTELVAQRTNEAKALATIQVEKASVEGERKMVEADLGPVRYLATLIGAGPGRPSMVHPGDLDASGSGRGLAPVGRYEGPMILGRGRCTSVTGRRGRPSSFLVWAITGHSRTVVICNQPVRNAHILPCPRLMVWRIAGAVTLSEIWMSHISLSPCAAKSATTVRSHRKESLLV
jgi:hypothetical protein